MAIKYVDIEYLRAQNSSAGQLILAGQSNTLTYTNYVTVDTNGNVGVSENLVIQGGVGIGTSTSPTSGLNVYGDVNIFGSLNANDTNLAYGPLGTIQFSTGDGNFTGSPTQLYWDSGNVKLGIGTSKPVSTIQFNSTALESVSKAWSTTEPTVIDSFPAISVRSAHYFVQVTDEDNSLYHTSQIMVVQDGITAYKSEYNTVTSGDKLGSFDTQINAGNLELIFTAFDATNKTVKITRTSMTA